MLYKEEVLSNASPRKTASADPKLNGNFRSRDHHLLAFLLYRSQHEFARWLAFVNPGLRYTKIWNSP